MCIGFAVTDRNRVWWLGLVLVLVACGSGGESPATTSNGLSAALAEHLVGGDILLKMETGDGPGLFDQTSLDSAEELTPLQAAGFFALQGHGGLRDGMADHVAWFDGEYGRMHVVTFRAGQENPRGGEPEFCVALVLLQQAGPLSSGVTCGLDPDEPMFHGGGVDVVGVAGAFGGTDVAKAVFITESQKTVSVLTVGGWAFAEWPLEWGAPQAVEFHDTARSLVTTLEAAAGF